MKKVKKQYQYEVIDKWLKSNNQINKSKLSTKLGISRPTLNNLLNLYLQGEDAFFFHGNSNKIPHNKISENIKQTIIELYLSEIQKLRKFYNGYKYGLNFSMFYKLKIKDVFNISERSTYNILRKVLIVSPESRKNTKKIIRKELKNKINDSVPMITSSKNEIEFYETIEELNNLKPCRGKSGAFGSIVELDATQILIKEGKPIYLFHAIDRFTDLNLGIVFEEQETSFGYLRLIEKVLRQFGKPIEFVTDKRRSFWASENTQSKIGSMLLNLDIKLTCSSEPTAKPNVERSMRNGKNFYPLIFVEKKVETLSQAIQIEDLLTTEYNNYYKKTPITENVFTYIDCDEIEEKVVFKSERIVSKSNSISWKEKFCVAHTNEGKYYFMKSGSVVTVIENTKNESFILKEGRKLYIKEPNGGETDYIEAFESLKRNVNEKIRLHENKEKTLMAVIDKKQLKLENTIRILDKKIKYYNELLEKNLTP